MKRKNFRTLWLTVGWALLVAATWTHGAAGTWLIRGSLAAIGGLLGVEWFWRLEKTK